MELKFFSPIKFSNLNWRLNPSYEGWDAGALNNLERILSGECLLWRGGGGGGPSKSVVGGGKESRTFFIDQLNFLFSLSPLSGTRSTGAQQNDMILCSRTGQDRTGQDRTGQDRPRVSTPPTAKNVHWTTVDKPDWSNWHQPGVRPRHWPPMFMFILSIWQS